jgi:hypothetical protein
MPGRELPLAPQRLPRRPGPAGRGSVTRELRLTVLRGVVEIDAIGVRP